MAGHPPRNINGGCNDSGRRDCMNVTDPISEYRGIQWWEFDLLVLLRVEEFIQTERMTPVL